MGLPGPGEARDRISCLEWLQFQGFLTIVMKMRRSNGKGLLWLAADTGQAGDHAVAAHKQDGMQMFQEEEIT